MIEDFFPKEIIDLMYEYIKSNQHSVAVNNLWIDVETWYEKDDKKRKITVRMNPNYNRCKVFGILFDDFKLFSEHKTFCYKGTNINDLNEAIKQFEIVVNQFKDYEMLEKELEKNIEGIYKILADWKKAKIEKHMNLLSSINYEDLQTVKRYKVSIIIEEM